MRSVKPSISAIVLAYNEELHIRECLESLLWCDEIWVVDSFSTDETLAICREYTSNIVQHAFENFAAQRNWALDSLPLSGDWIFFVDSDQRVTPVLREEIRRRLEEEQGQYDGYFLPKLQYFWGKPLRFGGAYPAYEIALFRKGKGRCVESKIVHELLELEGRPGFLKNPIKAIARESIFEHIERGNWYSSLEALRMLRTGQELYTTESESYARIYQLLKAVFKHLPFKPVAYFLYVYLIRQGFRDGYRGLLFAVTEAFYVFTSYAKLWELKNGLVREEELVRRR